MTISTEKVKELRATFAKHVNSKIVALREQSIGVVAVFDELLAVREAQSVPAPIAFSENADADMCRTWAWEQVKKDVTTDSWTIGDSCNFYGFYCWGWDMRRQYNEQRPPALPDGYKLVPVELLSTASMLIDLSRTHATLNGGGTYNQRVLSDCETTMNAIANLLAAAPTPTK